MFMGILVIMHVIELSPYWSWLLVGSRLYCIQHLPCSVRLRCMLGGWNEEHSTLGHWGSNSFWHVTRCKIEFGPQCTEISCSSLRFKNYLPACTTIGRNYWYFMQIFSTYFWYIGMEESEKGMEETRSPSFTKEIVCVFWKMVCALRNVKMSVVVVFWGVWC